MRMVVMCAIVACAVALVLSLHPGAADQPGVVTITPPAPTVEFKAGPGVDKVKANCTVCHTADYVYTQPPLTAAQWRAEVTKMKKVFGAPIADEDVDAIVQYLVSQNGKT